METVGEHSLAFPVGYGLPLGALAGGAGGVWLRRHAGLL